MKYLSPSDIAARLGVSRSKVYRMLHDIPRARLGDRCVRVSEAELDAYLKRKTEAPWDGSTGDTKKATGTRTTRPPKVDESKEASEPKTSVLPANDYDLPNWAQRPLHVAKSKG